MLKALDKLARRLIFDDLIIDIVGISQRVATEDRAPLGGQEEPTKVAPDGIRGISCKLQ